MGKILIIEDDKSIRYLIKLILKMDNYELANAEDGELSSFVLLDIIN